MDDMSAFIDLHSSIFRRLIGVFILSILAFGCMPLHLPPPTPTPTALPPAKTVQPPQPTLMPSPTSALQLSDEQLRGVSIRFWHPYSGEIGASFDRLADEFSRQSQWQITVESQGFGGVDLLNEQMQAVLAQGNLPNLVIAPLYQALRWNQERSILVDWSLYTEDVRWGLSVSEKQAYYPNLWDVALMDGHRWGIAARRVAQLLLYNASWARELGFDAAPRTLTDFQEQACSLSSDGTQGGDSSAKGYLFSHDYPTILGWFMAFGAQIAGNDRLEYEFKSPEVQDAFFYLRKLFDQGCTLSVADLEPSAVFAQRQALFVPVHSGQLTAVEQTLENAANTDRWTVLPFPTANGEGAVLLYGTDFVLLQSSEREQLAAWLFVRWLLEKENQQRLAQETLGLSLRMDVAETLQGDAHLSAVYRAALGYLPLGVNEPMWASWDTVRWAVGDASRQLVAWYFSADQVPGLVRLLDRTATDLHSRH